MKYYNINNPDPKISFREAVTRGIASDKGLYMPERLPGMSSSFFRRLPQMSLPEIAFEVATEYTREEMAPRDLKKICDEAFSFPLVLKQTDGKKHVLELFHGPTAAFKDFGARFMAQCFRYFSDADNTKNVILVATSGDTGGAIASAFLGVSSCDVIILYPSGKVSSLQEQQLTTLGQNITAIEVRGTFDDCQRLVKEAFTGIDTKGQINLTSANSINIARLIPQSFYYYYAAGRCGNNTPVISIPSGNFGNLTGAVMAWRSGLKITRIIASTNINRVVPDYLMTGSFCPRESVQTIANAMDVGNPSNFDRLIGIFKGDHHAVTRMISGFWCTDEQIREHIRSVFSNTGYVLDPHGAVASMGLDTYMKDHPGATGIFLATAHPAKFNDVVSSCTGERINLPESLVPLTGRKKEAILMEPQYSQFEDYLRKRYDL